MSADSEKAYFGRRYMLSASHRLHSDALRARRTGRRMGSATIPMATGTTMWWKCWWAAMLDPETGMVVNLADLDLVVRKRVVERFDHANLNLDPEVRESGADHGESL